MTMSDCSDSSTKQLAGMRNHLRQGTSILTFALLSGCVALDPNDQAKPPSDRFSTSSGIVVEVSRTEGGPRYSRDAADLARQIKQLDATLENWRRSPGAADPAVTAEVVRVVTESRDAAVEDLALAYRIAGQTSGPLDNRIISGARDGVKYLQDLVKAPAASYKLNVRTSISSSGSASIHWVSAAEAEQSASPAWRPYRSGQLLRIGRYVFLVRLLNQTQSAFKTPPVLILTDPFVTELARLEM